MPYFLHVTRSSFKKFINFATGLNSWFKKNLCTPSLSFSLLRGVWESAFHGTVETSLNQSDRDATLSTKKKKKGPPFNGVGALNSLKEHSQQTSGLQ